MIGVLGGMGPMATADFLTKLIGATSAKRDSDHIPVIVQSLPQFPDRTKAILEGSPSPLPHMISMTNKRKIDANLALANACVARSLPNYL